jgi:hypothetical protein
MRRCYKLNFALNPQKSWSLIDKSRSHRWGIASESWRLIDVHVLMGLGSEPSHAAKAVKLTASRFRIGVLRQLQRSNTSTPSLVALLFSTMAESVKISMHWSFRAEASRRTFWVARVERSASP